MDAWNSLVEAVFTDKTTIHVQAFMFYLVSLPTIAGIAWLVDVACGSKRKKKRSKRT